MGDHRNDEDLHRWLSETFDHGECLSRELRLTEEEVAWVKSNCAAVLTDMGNGWYYMEFQEAYG
jgi:hypothetical protein